MKKKLAAIIVLLIVGIIGIGILFVNNKRTGDSIKMNGGVGNSRLEYLYGVIEETRSESIVVSLTSPVSESDDFMPKQGDKVYLFIPEKEVQEEVLNAYAKKDNIEISVYDLNSIHFTNGLYSIVIMDSSQVRKQETITMDKSSSTSQPIVHLFVASAEFE